MNRILGLTAVLTVTSCGGAEPVETAAHPRVAVVSSAPAPAVRPVAPLSEQVPSPDPGHEMAVSLARHESDYVTPPFRAGQYELLVNCRAPRSLLVTDMAVGVRPTEVKCDGVPTAVTIFAAEGEHQLRVVASGPYVFGVAVPTSK